MFTKFAPKEIFNLILLTVLYFNLGVPIGIVGTLTFTLKKYLSYTEIGLFSLAHTPYLVKFFWSPMVDTLYLKALGRRKTYVVLLGLVIGMLMLYLSFYIDDWIKSSDYLFVLTFTMFMVFFMQAT